MTYEIGIDEGNGLSQTRKLKATWSMEADQDLRFFISLAEENRFYENLLSSIEIDRTTIYEATNRFVEMIVKDNQEDKQHNWQKEGF